MNVYKKPASLYVMTWIMLVSGFKKFYNTKNRYFSTYSISKDIFFSQEVKSKGKWSSVLNLQGILDLVRHWNVGRWLTISVIVSVFVRLRDRKALEYIQNKADTYKHFLLLHLLKEHFKQILNQVLATWENALHTCSAINMTLMSIQNLEKNKLLEYFVTEFRIETLYINQFLYMKQVAQFLKLSLTVGKRQSQIYWTGGAYNEKRAKFAWFDFHEDRLIEVQDFNYTNWAVGYPGNQQQLTGQGCVLFSCSRVPCKWEVVHRDKSTLNFICEAPLSTNYKYPNVTKPRPNIKDFSTKTRNNRSNSKRNFICPLLFFFVIILLTF